MTKRDLFAERCSIVTMTIHARCCLLVVHGALTNTISSETAIVIIQLITLYLLDHSASFQKGGEILLFSTCNVGCNLTKADRVTTPSKQPFKPNLCIGFVQIAIDRLRRQYTCLLSAGHLKEFIVYQLQIASNAIYLYIFGPPKECAVCNTYRLHSMQHFCSTWWWSWSTWWWLWSTWWIGGGYGQIFVRSQVHIRLRQMSLTFAFLCLLGSC